MLLSCLKGKRKSIKAIPSFKQSLGSLGKDYYFPFYLLDYWKCSMFLVSIQSWLAGTGWSSNFSAWKVSRSAQGGTMDCPFSPQPYVLMFHPSRPFSMEVTTSSTQVSASPGFPWIWERGHIFTVPPRSPQPLWSQWSVVRCNARHLDSC